ncbi:hypothetical protein K9K77_02975 [Candidatus Babeliales bacterium]|nr:hypothetical protein [Candidatus Babeliales bacterium]
MKKLLLSLFILSHHSLLLSSQDPLFAPLPEGLFLSTISQDPLFSSSQNSLASFSESLLTSFSEDLFISSSEDQQPTILPQNLLPPFFNDQQENTSEKYITYMQHSLFMHFPVSVKEDFIFFNNFTFTQQELLALSISTIPFRKPSLRYYSGTFEEKKEQLNYILNPHSHKQQTFFTFKITKEAPYRYKIESFNQNNEKIKTNLVSTY